MSLSASVDPVPSKVIEDPSTTVYGPPAFATGTEPRAVMLTHHPVAIDPASNVMSSHMWSLQVPFGFVPLKTANDAPKGSTRPWMKSPVPKFVGLYVPPGIAVVPVAGS